MTRPPRRTAIKICCMESMDEARRAIGAGANAVGLVSEMPSGPGVIGEEQIALIARGVKEFNRAIAVFLLTSRRDPSAIAEQLRHAGCDTIQLVDSIAEGGHAELRALLPGVRLVQVIHVIGPESVEEAQLVAPAVDALLLDSGRPAGPDNQVAELGGTGRIHDWSISRTIREAVELPVYLAGGLNPENVGRAVTEVRPTGVDVCSGVRSGGSLDDEKLTAFVRAVRCAEKE